MPEARDMSEAGEAVVDDIVAVLPPLLQSLEALGFIARHLNPPDFGRVMEAAGTPDQALQAVAAVEQFQLQFLPIGFVEMGDGDPVDGFGRHGWR